MTFGWALAIGSLFYFNLDDRWDMWAAYYFGHFFLGVLAYHASESRRSEFFFNIYCGILVAALIVDWRWRLTTSLLTGLILYFGCKSGAMGRWPASRIVGYLGRTSYSLFLVHFPVWVVVAAIWVRLGWVSPLHGVAAMIVAYLTSLAMAAVFYELVESRAARLSPKI
jgi:peptidoglycan/LPS O-acetylase OafA/YrhL